MRLTEERISMILGAMVIIVIGVLIFDYFKRLPSSQTENQATEKQECHWVAVEEIVSLNRDFVLYKAADGGYYYDRQPGLSPKLAQPNQGICVDGDEVWQKE